MYGTGMRLMECLRLRVQDIDFARSVVLVRDGKGAKDRVTMLPQSLKAALRDQLARVKGIHEQDLSDGWGRVQLPTALDRKYPNARTTDAGSGSFRRRTAGKIQRPVSGAGTTSMHRSYRRPPAPQSSAPGSPSAPPATHSGTRSPHT